MPPGMPPGPLPGGLPPNMAPGTLHVPPSTTIYVGKISPLVDDELMRRVLEACGELRRCVLHVTADTAACV